MYVCVIVSSFIAVLIMLVEFIIRYFVCMVDFHHPLILWIM